MHAILVALLAAALVAAWEVGFGLFLTILPRLGQAGRRTSESFTRAPLLDLAVALLTWVPWVVTVALAGWLAWLGALAGQIAAMYAWSFIHEWAHPQAAKGPRIVTFLNKAVGRWRNHLALWFTLIAVPGFWIIRFHQWLVYPFLIWLLNFPRYPQAEWINVSRHKFEGLVGHDLIWCLYCDWMTGVYSLGAEMLRNVESFWCPIRFYDGKKCANCRADFPDIFGGWVAPDGNMQQVEAVLQEKYGDGQRTWFGHPARLTVNGKPVESKPASGEQKVE